MFSNLLQTARGILNSLICVVHFSSNLIVYFIKRFTKIVGAVAVCQEKGTDRILRIFTFNDKNQLYLLIFLTLHFFEGQRDQGVTQLVIKPFDISQTSRIVGLRLKKCQVFASSFYFSFIFLDNTSHKF